MSYLLIGLAVLVIVVGAGSCTLNIERFQIGGGGPELWEGEPPISTSQPVLPEDALDDAS